MGIETFHSNIRAGIRARLITLADLPAMAWEAREFSPVKGTPYISETLRPVSSRVRALGRGGNQAHTLIQTFGLFFPANQGTTASDALAGKLLKLFEPGTGIAYGGDTAMVQEAERMALVTQPDWINVPVIVTMTGYTANL